MIENFDDDVSAISQIDAVPHILEVVCKTTGMGFSAVARVTDSHWIACAVRDEIKFGLERGGELPLDTTICDEIRQSGEIVVIEDAESDERYSCHHTPKLYGFRSYISVPIVLANGKFFGTLCAIDPRPAKVKKSETIEMFKLFANLIALHIESRRQLIASEKALLAEQSASHLREQFIAVLGHDLRNPLGAIKIGVHLLSQSVSGEDEIDVCQMLDRGVNRMTELIENVLDLARGRLGSGLSIELKHEDKLEGMLSQIVEELESAWPGRTIHRQIAINETVYCNRARIGQMLSNLLGNALTHGDSNSPIRVLAKTSENGFEASVTNQGPTIPPETIGRLFQPFVRGSEKLGQQGLGLGLYISAEIARAHGGTLEVTSLNGETCFTFRVPTTTK